MFRYPLQLNQEMSKTKVPFENIYQTSITYNKLTFNTATFSQTRFMVQLVASVAIGQLDMPFEFMVEIKVANITNFTGLMKRN